MPALALTRKGPRIAHREARRRPGEARIKLLVGGVCATDIELVKGYMGFSGVLGHEFVGLVVDAPDRRWVGRRVVGEINCACQTCETCRGHGGPHHCPNRTVLGIQGRDGAFADHFYLPLANLHEVPEHVPSEAAVFVEPLAAACRILEQVRVRPGERVVVLGKGRLGRLCAAVLETTGAHVVALGRGEGDPAPADLVVDATGSPDGLARASRLVRPRGTIVLKTTVHGQTPAPATGWVVDEVTVVGSRCGPFKPALKLLADGVIDPRPMISDELPLAEGVAALARAAQPGVLKVLLRP